MSLNDQPYQHEHQHWFQDFNLSNVNQEETLAILQDQAVYHALTKEDVFNEPRKDPSTVFMLDRYYAEIFQGIMPDTGAAGVSTAGRPQFQALQKIDPTVQLDVSTAGKHSIRGVGKGELSSEGTIHVQTPLGTIRFEVLPAAIPFLLCIADMDKLGVIFDNINNVLIQGNKRVPIVRKFGHPFMLLHDPGRSLAYSHFTETELRQLHRRLGHPASQRLITALQRAGHEVDNEFVKHLTKVCHQCQIHGKSPGRFKFTLTDDHEFNHTIYVDIFHLEDGPVLHVVDSATAFNAGRFIKDFSAQEAWDVVRICWIDVYQGPPEYIVTDAGRNFASKEFKQNAKVLDINVKEVPVEAHNSVGKVERYHGPVRRAYTIIKAELTKDGSRVSKEVILQMALKAINDTAGPDGLVPTLLVFGSYARMSEFDPPTPTVAQRGKAVQKAMEEIRATQAKRKVADALNIRNGPNTLPTITLQPNSKVIVWREHGGPTKRGAWDGPHTLVSVEGETCTVDAEGLHGHQKFRSTSVKPYYEDITQAKEDKNDNADGSAVEEIEVPIERRGRGRPKGSRNKERNPVPQRHSERIAQQEQSDEQFVTGIDVAEIFTTAKEKADWELVLTLRRDGKITTAGAPFQESTRVEIESLMAGGVFNIVQWDPAKHTGKRIFNSRIVNEVKGKTTQHPYEKSRLVIQAYNDEGKAMILTQSPTIQRISQRLLLAFGLALMKKKGAVI